MGGVAINFVLPENPDLAVIEITDYLNSVLDEARASHPGIDYHTTGDVVMNRTFSDATQSDIQTLTPIVFLIIVVATVVLLRSVFATVAVVAVLMFAINTTMGFAGWRGVVFSPTNAGVPIIVMVVAVADSIHIVTTALLGMRRGLDKRAAIVESFRVNAYPIFLTSLTTAIGFLSLNASDSPPFPCPGKLRGVRRGRRFRIHHDAPAGAAGAPAAAPVARPGCRARVLRPLLRPISPTSSSPGARCCSGPRRWRCWC